MGELAVISAIITSVKTATDIAKLIKDSDLSLEKSELKLKLAELVSSLADAKLQMVEIQETILDKDRRIKELETVLETKNHIVKKYDAYYECTEDGTPNGQPYCMHCWEAKHKAYHLHFSAINRGVKECSECITRYEARTTPELPEK